MIEDAAHGLFARYRGRPLGGLGALGAVSFDSAKNITCGEGGALLVNDARLFDAVETAYQRGTNRASMLRGEITEYEWLAAGGNYEPSALQAAFLLSQLEGAAAIQHRRRTVWNRYTEELRGWADAGQIVLPFSSADDELGYHVFYLLFPDAGLRGRAASHLADCGIESASHYRPLHASPGGRASSDRRHACPNAEGVAGRLLRIPLHGELSDTDVDRVVDALTTFRP